MRYLNKPNLSFMKKAILLIFLLFSTYIFGQEYTDYLGAGHVEGISVTTSSDQTREDWNEIATGENTVNGHGMDARLFETSRLLAQSTFGTDLSYIENISTQDFENWIESQFNIPTTTMTSLTNDIYDQALQLWISNGNDPEDYFGPDSRHFLYAWWQTNMNNEDLLRQRIALALSEIFVISMNSNLQDYGDGLANYYDLLADHAFSNFYDLLMAVTLHPMMGFYLSHYNNHRTIPAANIHPDENYAREIMQLFSIGLYELNSDGSYVLDGNNERIPTYNNDDIKEFAKVFTGLGPAEVIENEWGVVPEFGVDFWFCKKDVPMAMYEEWHEEGEKYLLNGYIIPAGQSGMEDIEETVDHLFNHPNVGPFLAKRLIQRLVKSNPSPQYIENVANAFNNTNGIRGDMKAVIKAILLDEEARSCSWINHPHQGKLKEPMIRYFNLARQVDIDNPFGQDWNTGYTFYQNTGQAPLAAPSVFNFFLPDYVPNGPISDAGLVAPEFQIHNSSTSLGYVNMVDLITYPEWYPIFENWDINWEDNARLDFEALKYWAKDPEVLLNRLDKLFTHGLLSDDTKNIIVAAITPIQGSDPNVDYMHYRVKMALYLLFVSPEYNILK